MAKIKGRRLDYLLINEIDLGARVRENLGDLDGLASSVRTHGIIKPIAVVDKTYIEVHKEELILVEEDNRKKYLLLAGERRIKASLLADFSRIPCHIWEIDLALEHIKALEMTENLHNKRMTWVEEVMGIHKIHQSLVFLKRAPQYKGDPWAHYAKHTAKLINKSDIVVKQALQLAEAFEDYPALKDCKHKTEALNTLKDLKVIEEGLNPDVHVKSHSEVVKDLTEQVVPVALPLGTVVGEEGGGGVQLDTDLPNGTPTDGNDEDGARGIDGNEDDTTVERTILLNTEDDPIFEKTKDQLKGRLKLVEIPEIKFPEDFFDLIIINALSPVKVKVCTDMLKNTGTLLCRTLRGVEMPEEDLMEILEMFCPKDGKVFCPDSINGNIIFAGVITGRDTFAATQTKGGFEQFIEKVERGYPYG